MLRKVVALSIAAAAGAAVAAPLRQSFIADITIDYAPNHPLNRFRPQHALGAGIDGGPSGETQLFTPANVAAMESVGFKSLTLRLRTELAIDAWHWNPAGTWSDSAHAQGYWTSDSRPITPIITSYGYAVPRRGNTIDQADNTGYSRLDDGDEATIWKSNPYLDEHFTHEPNARHEQWIVIDLGAPKPVDALRIAWDSPFARAYTVDYALEIKDISAIALNEVSLWRAFPNGTVTNARGGDDLLRLAPKPILARFIRLRFRDSAGAPRSADIRDTLGFAIRELSVGILDGKGELHDEIVHAPDQTQTVIHVSSTDPWHRAADIDRGTEQPGFDRIAETGLTHNLPVLIGLPLLYDTPENAAAAVSYLEARHFPLERVELGEEPDGQYATPEDYGALYLQFAAAIHGVDPVLKLGGPSFQEVLADKTPLKVRRGNSIWFKRFQTYLRAHHRDADYSFFSFEWYPIDDICAPPAPKLVEAHRLLGVALAEMQRRGLTHRTPWLISEYGYSAYAARAELDLDAALLDADLIGSFLSLGGDQAFLYGLPPGRSQRDLPCTAGNNLLFAEGAGGTITHKFAAYHAARMITQRWATPTEQELELFGAQIRTAPPDAQFLSGYPLRRPDGSWSTLLINRDPQRAARVTLRLYKAGEAPATLQTPLEIYQFSAAQYQLRADEAQPLPIKSQDPAHFTLDADTLDLPPYSLSVVNAAGVASPTH